MIWTKDDFSKMLDTVDIDIIWLCIGEDIMKTDTYFLKKGYRSKLDSLKEKLFETLGYRYPAIRITDDIEIPNNEYIILVRGRQVAKGEFKYNSQESLNKIFETLENVIIQHVHEIFTVKETYEYIDYIKENYSKKIADKLLKNFDIYEIKNTLCNLIQQRISIANLPIVIKKLEEFSKYKNIQQNYFYRRLKHAQHT